jgi:hypothetical protein
VSLGVFERGAASPDWMTRPWREVTNPAGTAHCFPYAMIS